MKNPKLVVGHARGMPPGTVEFEAILGVVLNNVRLGLGVGVTELESQPASTKPLRIVGKNVSRNMLRW